MPLVELDQVLVLNTDMLLDVPHHPDLKGGRDQDVEEVGDVYSWQHVLPALASEQERADEHHYVVGDAAQVENIHVLLDVIGFEHVQGFRVVAEAEGVSFIFKEALEEPDGQAGLDVPRIHHGLS